MLSSRIAPIRKTHSATRQKVRVLCTTSAIVSHYPTGQLQQLLSFSEDFPQELGRFLEPHDHLSWMHHISTQDYSKVGEHNF